MNRAIIIFLIVGFIGLISGTAFAYPSSVTINSSSDAGSSYTDGFSRFFEAGTYQFTVAGGAWNDTLGFYDNWMWSAWIYDGSKEYLLGSTTKYPTATDAFNAHSSDSLSLSLSSDSNLWFYINDSSAYNNTGSVTIGITTQTGTPPIVPEPISSILFIAGGAVFSGRAYLKKQRANALLKKEAE